MTLCCRVRRMPFKSPHSTWIDTTRHAAWLMEILVVYNKCCRVVTSRPEWNLGLTRSVRHHLVHTVKRFVSHFQRLFLPI